MSGIETEYSAVSSSTFYQSALNTFPNMSSVQATLDDSLAELMGVVNAEADKTLELDNYEVVGDENAVHATVIKEIHHVAEKDSNGITVSTTELKIEEKVELHVEEHKLINGGSHEESTLYSNKQQDSENVETKRVNGDHVFAEPMPPKNHLGGSGRFTPRVANSIPLMNSTNVPHYMAPTFSAARRVEETKNEMAIRSAKRATSPKRMVSRKFSNSNH